MGKYSSPTEHLARVMTPFLLGEKKKAQRPELPFTVRLDNLPFQVTVGSMSGEISSQVANFSQC